MSAATKWDNVDDWAPGLIFKLKVLNTKTVKRAKTPGEVLPVCLAHNLRQGNDMHRHRSRIDPDRAHMNEAWAGPDKLDVALAIVRDTLESFDIEPKRRDTIMGVEMVIQPPHGIDLHSFWAECMAWAHGRFEHVVSAMVHHDQKRPHMHILALAIRGGRLAGNELTASPYRRHQRRADFMAHMRRVLGLRPDREVKPGKTLAELAVSTGKGPKTRAEAERRDAALIRSASEVRQPANVGMGVDGHGGSVLAKYDPQAHAKEATPLIAQLSRADKVALLWALIADLNGTTGEPIPAPVLVASGDAKTPPDIDATDTVRVRDADMPADCWDSDTGTFRPRPPPHMPIKAAAQAWVKAALQDIQGQHATAPCGT
jgi:hypothetical protein